MITILLNPAGGNATTATRAEIESTLTACGIEHHIRETEPDESLAALVQHAVDAGTSTVVAAGGDGTVSEVARALVGTDIPLGILPLGTANLIARDLQIPLNVAEACSLLQTPEQTVAIDAMRVDDQHYFSHISTGFYANLAKETDVTTKKRLGRFAYVMQALRDMVQEKAWRFQLTIDGQLSAVQASTIMLANVRAMGFSGLEWGDQISIRDETIDVCIVRARTVADYSQTFRELWQGAADKATLIEYHRAKRSIQVVANSNLPIRGDGEIIGHGTVDIIVVPRALQVVAPPQSG